MRHERFHTSYNRDQPFYLSFKPFQCEGRLYTSKSDVYIRQIMTYNVDPRTERIKKIYNGRGPII